jgi:hypothetical protein
MEGGAVVSEDCRPGDSEFTGEVNRVQIAAVVRLRQ